MKRFHRVLVALCVPFVTSGCFVTTQSYTDLQSEISSLKRTIGQMQSNQADLVITMQELNGSMIGLTEKLQENKERMSTLSLRMDDLETNLTQRIDTLSQSLSGTTVKTGPAPSALYDVAYNDYSQARFELAAAGFRNFVDRYPNSELAERAQYYLGVSLLRAKETEAAKEQFHTYLKAYPKSDRAESAREMLLKLEPAAAPKKPQANVAPTPVETPKSAPKPTDAKEPQSNDTRQQPAEKKLRISPQAEPSR